MFKFCVINSSHPSSFDEATHVSLENLLELNYKGKMGLGEKEKVKSQVIITNANLNFYPNGSWRNKKWNAQNTEILYK